ncbi:MAG: family acetyltransferase [Alphaproteobacteria bacterium]|nr:family acetyltransferase [Alphaproteobacteria bacterium]
MSFTIRPATEGDIPFIRKNYTDLVQDEPSVSEAPSPLDIREKVLSSQPQEFINVMRSGTDEIGFIHYRLELESDSKEENVYIQALYIDSLAPRMGLTSIGRTVLNYLFVQHRGIAGAFVSTMHANKALQSVTSRHNVDFRYNAYSQQSGGNADNPMVLTVRSATPADIPFIIKGNQVIDQKSGEIPPNPLNEARLNRDVFHPTHPRAFILIADVDDQPVGFIIYSFCYFSSKGEGLWLSNFYIDPFCRKSGVGKAMANHMKSLHPEASSVFGAVACVNNVARHFFRSLGGKAYTDYFIYGMENDWGKVWGKVE